MNYEHSLVISFFLLMGLIFSLTTKKYNRRGSIIVMMVFTVIAIIVKVLIES